MTALPAFALTLSAALCQDDVVIRRDAELRETNYTISAGDCRISWTAYESELNRDVIRHRSDCSLSLREQALLIGKLLRKVMDSRSDAARFPTLSWGRLYPDGARDATLSVRLALAAKRSAEWDPVRGSPRGNDLNGWVRKVANDALIYEELRSTLLECGIDIRLAAVEKVLVLKARSLPFYDRLRAAGIKPEDKVPFDCQAWFSMQPSRRPAK